MKEGDPQKTVDQATVVVVTKEGEYLADLCSESKDARTPNEINMYLILIEQELERLSPGTG